MSLSDFNKKPEHDAPEPAGVSLLREIAGATNKARETQEKRDRQHMMIECATTLAASMLANSAVPIGPDDAGMYAVKCARTIFDLVENY